MASRILSRPSAFGANHYSKPITATFAFQGLDFIRSLPPDQGPFRPCDGPFYRGKRVAVVGGGNSAAEESLLLIKFASHVTILVRGGELKASRIIQEKVLTHPKIDVRWHTEVKEFHGENAKLTRLSVVDNQTKETGVGILRCGMAFERKKQARPIGIHGQGPSSG